VVLLLLPLLACRAVEESTVAVVIGQSQLADRQNEVNDLGRALTDIHEEVNDDASTVPIQNRVLVSDDGQILRTLNGDSSSPIVPICAVFHNRSVSFDLLTTLPDDVVHNAPRRLNPSEETSFAIHVSVVIGGNCMNDEYIHVIEDTQPSHVTFRLATNEKIGMVLKMFVFYGRTSKVLLVGAQSGHLYDEMTLEVKERFTFAPPKDLVFHGKHSWNPELEANLYATLGRGTYPNDLSIFKVVGILDELHWNITIGQFCSVAPFTFYGMLTASHQYSRPSTYPFEFFTTHHPSHPVIRNRHIQIGNDVWIGEGVTIINSVKIGDGAVIGANSVIRADIPPYAIAVGNPATVVKYRFPEDIVEKMMSIKWWDWSNEDVIRKMKDETSIESFVAKYFHS
jgi:acetyltransferase-like isoleucine patch superfamily enzyme